MIGQTAFFVMNAFFYPPIAPPIKERKRKKKLPSGEGKEEKELSSWEGKKTENSHYGSVKWFCFATGP
jgi:hypothetical protein